MKKELKELLAQDLSRIYDHPLTLKDRFFLPKEVQVLHLWRKASFYRSNNKFLSKVYGYRLMQEAKKTQIQIPSEATIGPGLYLGHLGRIIIHPDVVMGKNINLGTGITIGQCNRGAKKGTPTIGNEVWIGTNAVIVGKIKIGDDVLIAPGAYVNTDVPSHSIVIGNPAVIHPCLEATKDYINRKV